MNRCLLVGFLIALLAASPAFAQAEPPAALIGAQLVVK